MAFFCGVIYSQSGVVRVIHIGHLPMGSRTLALQCCKQRFYFLPDDFRVNGSPGGPTDQALNKQLTLQIFAKTPPSKTGHNPRPRARRYNDCDPARVARDDGPELWKEQRLDY